MSGWDIWFYIYMSLLCLSILFKLFLGYRWLKAKKTGKYIVNPDSNPQIDAESQTSDEDGAIYVISSHNNPPPTYQEVTELDLPPPLYDDVVIITRL